MRDNIRHMASMGRQSRIGSEMQWGDGRTGSEIEIHHPGEGMSNGLRLDAGTGESLGRGVPGRFKAWYAADTAESAEFWARVAAVAPDASLVRLPHVSDAARDPAAAMEALRAKAYEEYSDPDHADEPADPDLDRDDPADEPDVPTVEADRSLSVPQPRLDPGHTDGKDDERGWDQLLPAAAAAVVRHGQGSAAMLQRELRVGYERGRQLMVELEAVGIVGPVRGRKARTVLVRDQRELEQRLRDHGLTSPPPPHLPVGEDAPQAATDQGDAAADEPRPAEPDGEGLLWETVSAVLLDDGDVVQFGDIDAAVVVDALGVVVDDFDNSEVVRLVLDVHGVEEVVDLSEDDVVYRRAVFTDDA